MHIKPSEIALNPAPAAIGPLAAAQLVVAATPSLRDNASLAGHGQALLFARDQVSFSEIVRTLSVALAQALPELDSALLYDVLAPADRLVVANAVALSQAQGSAPHEVRGLVLDLYAYRSPVPKTQATATTNPLALATFSAQDEAVARTILSSVALRDTALDHGFVRALLDPDRHPTHAVSFDFLRRLLVALSPAHSEGTVDPDSAFARRAARTTLAQAVEALGLARSDLPNASAEVAQQSRTLLKEWLAKLPQTPAAIAAQPNDSTLLQEPAGPERARQPVRLTGNDRTLLGLLYVTAKQRGRDLSAVDHVASALLALRKAERAELASLRLPRPSLPIARERAASAPSTQAVPEPERLALDGQPEPTRSYGSDAQRAAKLAGTYKSLLPPSPLYGALGPRPESQTQPLAALLAQARLAPPDQPAPPQLPTLTRPLDLTQALGLGALVSELRAHARRAVRPRLRRKSDPTIRAVEALPKSASEAEADDPVLDGAQQQSRTRWRLLLRRRQKQRRPR